jgi:hypothetical protein
MTPAHRATFLPASAVKGELPLCVSGAVVPRSNTCPFGSDGEGALVNRATQHE